MASPNLQGKTSDISVNFLPFTDHIGKIPEPQSVNQHNYYQLPCSNDYALVSIYVDLFKILSVLLGVENLRAHVLSHIRQHWKYYNQTASTYLHQKRLSLAEWLTQMWTFEHIPADEICLHACGTYLNIHIAVLYIGGMWTTLNMSTASDKLQTALCDMHLAYMGNNTYNLLCKQSELKTKARKLLNHKYEQRLLVTTNTLQLQINLPKAEFLTQWLDNLSITQDSMNKLRQYKARTLEKSTPSPTSNYPQHEEYDEMYNTSTELYTDSEGTELYYISDSTEQYEMDEVLLGTIQVHDTKMRTTKTQTAPMIPDSKNSVKLFKFKCPFSKCSV